MIRLFLSLAAIALSLVGEPLWADGAVIRRLRDVNGVEIRLVKTGKGFVSPACARDLDSCVANWAIKVEVESFQPKFPSSPAALSCEGAGGRSFTALDESNNEYALCVFSGGRFVDAWDLYAWQQKQGAQK